MVYGCMSCISQPGFSFSEAIKSKSPFVIFVCSVSSLLKTRDTKKNYSVIKGCRLSTRKKQIKEPSFELAQINTIAVQEHVG